MKLVLSAQPSHSRSSLQRAKSLVQQWQGRLKVENGNPTSPVPVNSSFTAQLHKLSKRFKRRRSNIESAWLARFANK
jgi:hypothetical protein